MDRQKSRVISPGVTEEPAIRAPVTFCLTSLLSPTPYGTSSYWTHRSSILTLTAKLSLLFHITACCPEAWPAQPPSQAQEISEGWMWSPPGMEEEEETKEKIRRSCSKTLSGGDLPAFVDQLNKSQSCILLDGVLPFLQGNKTVVNSRKKGAMVHINHLAFWFSDWLQVCQ